jgi:HTH-type transcriptional regulator, sugar sensing transcriptional regulator
MDTAERLLRGLGFTGYEARIMIALTRRHPANGYEIGKLSGVPTSKVYAALDGLRSGGFIVADETRSPVRYDPVPIAEIASKLRSAHDGAVESLEGELRRIAPLPEPELSWNIPDYGSVLERIRRLMREAESRVMLSIWPRELEALRPEIELALGRGLRIVVACFGKAEGLGPLAMDISGCAESSARRLGSRLTVVAAEGLGSVISEMRGEDDTVGLWTSSEEVLLVAEEYLRHDLWGRALLDELGEGALDRLREKSPLMRFLLDKR